MPSPATERDLTFRANWTHHSGDPGLCLFTAALKAAPPEVNLTGHVLEIGCAECNWLTLAHEADPTLTLTGIDWRQCERRGATIVQADVRMADLPGQHYDAIVAISSLEHIGLGYYNHDPLDDDGDLVTISNCYRWLKPGGLLYFDVPYRPDESYRVIGTKYRQYDDDALSRRLLRPFWGEGGEIVSVSYAHGSRPGTLIAKPTTGPLGGRPFYYAAVWARKAA